MSQRIEPIGPRTGIASVTAPLRLTAVDPDEERRPREEPPKRPKPSAPPDSGDGEERQLGSRLDVRA